MSPLFPLSNDLFLFALLVWLGYLLFLEFIGDYLPSKSKDNASVSSKDDKSGKKSLGKKRHVIPKNCRPLLCPPVYSSSVSRQILYMELQSQAKYIPRNVCIATTVENDLTENIRKRSASISQRKSLTAANHHDLPTNNNHTNQTEPSPETPSRASVTNTRMSVSSPNGENGPSDLEVCKKVIFPYPTGCDPTGAEAKYLLQKFPVLTRPDVVRYLVARKGNVQAAEEMIEKCLGWRNSVFPLKKKDTLAAFQTQCFFPYGRAKDGSPVVYMRGGLYDCNKATPEQYVLAAAYTIDWSLRQYPDQTNVTVLVHTVNIPGGPNQSADTNFIKLFIQVS